MRTPAFYANAFPLWQVTDVYQYIMQKRQERHWLIAVVGETPSLWNVLKLSYALAMHPMTAARVYFRET